MVVVGGAVAVSALLIAFGAVIVSQDAAALIFFLPFSSGSGDIATTTQSQTCATNSGSCTVTETQTTKQTGDGGCDPAIVCG
jgi:hypothetical protein